jgi:hypothetical protein
MNELRPPYAHWRFYENPKSNPEHNRKRSFRARGDISVLFRRKLLAMLDYVAEVSQEHSTNMTGA